MSGILSERIKKLRKRTRSFLTQVDNNSKQIKKDIKKLYSENLTSTEYDIKHKDEKNICFQRSTRAWMLRNNSSGVCGVLCPDYFCATPTYISTSMSNIPQMTKVQITSNTHNRRQGLENVPRKPVKECYCYPETKKLQLRSTRTQHAAKKQNCLCNRSKSCNDFTPVAVKENLEKITLTPPISCETLRRVQKIDYAPRSEFLRHVQNKISRLQIEKLGDCREVCFRPQYHHKYTAENHIKRIQPINELECSSTQLLQSNYTSEELTSLSETSITSKASEEDKCSRHSDVAINKSNKESKVPLQKQSKSKLVIKRTISSKKSVPEMRKNKSIVKTQSRKTRKPTQSYNTECTCCQTNNLKNIELQTVSEEPICKHTGEHYTDAEYYKQVGGVTANRGDESGKDYSSDKEVKGIRKFREQNYFDTHGSSQTLMSPESSGSLEQYFLNERLFPEAVRKVHKKDLVVTVPACTNMQRKRIHYFPRYTIRQEKSSCNTNYKKKRCQSCPLTGHAIDFGVLKIQPPINSLALKYQKRLT